MALDRDDAWVDDEAGPIVRPFAVTRGRAQPATGTFDMITLVRARQDDGPDLADLAPEHRAILELGQQVLSVAEIAAYLSLPLGAVRVLLGDLLVRELIDVWSPRPSISTHDDGVLEKVLDGLRDW